ncbi:urea ABC transporter permease subunit UrtB [Enterovirga rhinocerotis]|uniref:urea ABC transporter permease subunit UrtB n=1 Tax=Enterovirga rhinocerotis TaxID=1339210 RepID=UPI001062003A|nr:urea ABC transporter permease subunit UrtB [Enterovirga rhinocerotis]
MRPVALLIAFVLGVLLLAPAVARADAYTDALARFAADSFSETEAAIDGVAASGHPLAADVVGAVREGRLMVRAADKAVFIRDPDGSFRDAGTGSPAAVQGADLKPVRLNNRVRRAVEAAMGTLTLRSPDRARRAAAAAAVFKSRDASALPALEAALAAETDPAIRRQMQEARAAILLTRPEATPDQRAEAITVLRARGDQEAVAVLRNLPADAPPAIRAMAGDAITAIENRIALLRNVQNVVYGISLGSVLLLSAIGLAVTFGVMGVINMAHGEMVMLGAYTTFVVQEVIRSHAPWLFDSSLFIALPLAFLVAGAVGVLIERSVIRFLYGRPLETLLATWGISLILQQAVRTVFGANNREVGNPGWMSGSFDLLGLTLTWNRLVIIVFALVVFAALLVSLKRTALGLQIRAVTQNRRMAGAMGIRTDWVDALTFGLGSGIAGIAGVALSQIDNVSPNLGQGYIIDSFLVVVFGGVGNLWGTLVGAMSIGIANKLLEPFAGAVLGKIILLVAIILFIQKRPRGLFALKGRFVEG